MIRLTGLNHVNLLSPDLARTCAFYAKFGYRAGPRPQFAEPGEWLYANGLPTLHINFCDPHALPSHDGLWAHVGFNVLGSIERVTGELLLLDIEYDLWPPVPGSHRALYIEGPFGERIEFVFVEVLG